MEEQDRILYIFGDGDRVRERIEGLLLSNDLQTLSYLSRGLSEAITMLANQLIEKMKAEVLMAAGDDLLVRVPISQYSRQELEQLADAYRSQTGSFISFGVGPTVESAYLNLRRAKSSDVTKIVEVEVLR